MKTKSLSAALFILAAAFAIYVFNYPPKAPKPTCGSEGTICMNYDEPISKLPVSVVRNMVDNYKSNQLNVINKTLQLDDARSNWFSLEELKKFIYNVEIKAKNNARKTIESKDLGIRMYYASYPARLTDYHKKALKSKNLSDKAVDQYPRLHTLIMIPTRRDGDLNIDFDPDNAKTYSTPLNQLKYYAKQNATLNDKLSKIGSDLTSTLSEDPSISALNHGSLIPPRTSGGDGESELDF